IRLDKDYGPAHYNLGCLLLAKGDNEGAIAEYREAIRVQSDNAEAHCNLGKVLQFEGRLAEALDALKRGHEIGSKRPGWPYASAEWVREAERLVILDGKLIKVIQGKAQPADTAERLALAELCQTPARRLYAAATRPYADASAAEPKLAEDLNTFNRYNAACAAALAASVQGQDAAQLGTEERARLRRQALDWLSADLRAWRSWLETDSAKAGPVAAQQFEHWQKDPDFAGVRGPQALARLPEAERTRWVQLWADVADTLANTQGKRKSDKGEHGK